MHNYRASLASTRSRLSMHPRGRESIFASDPYRGDEPSGFAFSESLRECVLSMEDCCEEMNEVQHALRKGTYDLPRMTRVLDHERVFTLVGESTVRRYQADVVEEVEPQINELVSRAQKGVHALQTRQSLMQDKVDEARKRASKPAVNVNKQESRQLYVLEKNREQLEKELGRLQAEVVELESRQRR